LSAERDKKANRLKESPQEGRSRKYTPVSTDKRSVKTSQIYEAKKQRVRLLGKLKAAERRINNNIKGGSVKREQTGEKPNQVRKSVYKLKNKKRSAAVPAHLKLTAPIQEGGEERVRGTGRGGCRAWKPPKEGISYGDSGRGTDGKAYGPWDRNAKDHTVPDQRKEEDSEKGGGGGGGGSQMPTQA